MTACFLVGFCAVAVSARSLELPRGAGPLPTQVGLTVSVRDGVLSAYPSGQLLKRTRLSTRASARPKPVRVVNVSGEAQALHLRAQPSIKDLDALLRVEIKSAAGTAFAGELAELRGWTPLLQLAPGQGTKLTIDLSLVRGGSAAQGRVGQIELELRGGQAGG